MLNAGPLRAGPSDFERARALEVLNNEWQKYECDRGSKYDSAPCANVRVALEKSGLRAPLRSDLSGEPAVELGEAYVVTEPSHLVAKEAAATKLRCAQRCGLVVGALATSAAGAAGYAATQVNFPPKASTMSSEAGDAARAVVFTTGAMTAGALTHTACNYMCGSVDDLKVHLAADEAFEIRGVYRHEAKTAADVDAFKEHIAKKGPAAGDA